MKTQNVSVLRKIVMLSLLSLIIWISACNQNDDVTKDNGADDLESILFEPTNGQSLLSVNYQLSSGSTDIESQDIQLPILVAVPDQWESMMLDGPIPTVIVVHGSGGLWEDDNTTTGEMSSQFDAWKEILTNEGMIAVFVESFQARGIQKNSNLSVEDKMKISEQFIRPRDLEKTVETLSMLVDANDNSIVGKIALLGFSHGGSTVRNAVHDCSTTADITEWSVSFDGISYDVPPPVCSLDQQEVTAVVSYYPGGFDRGYWGNPREGNSVYRNAVPMMVHMAENDDLTSDTNDLITKNLVGQTEVTYFTYEEAEHSFDHPDVTGVNATARLLAQQRTLEFLQLHLD